MNFEATPRQVLAIWRMLFTGEEPSQTKLGAYLGSKGAKERQQLVDAGLIELEKRGRAKHAILTEKAWGWAAEHLDAEISQSKLAAFALEGLLVKLKLYMGHNDVALVEILSPPAVPAPPVLTEELLREAYFRASGGRSNVRVRLSTLRRLLPHITRDQLDSLLTAMQRREKLVLFSFDDPQEITSEDRQAALDLGGGIKRHIVYMGG